MTELSDILQRLEQGAQFSSKGLEQYRDLSGESEQKDLASARKAYYEQVETALLETDDYAEIMELTKETKAAYLNEQAKVAQEWLSHNKETIQNGLGVIENPVVRENLNTVYADSVQTMKDGSKRFLPDRPHAILSVQAQELKKKHSPELETLFNASKSMVEHVGDVTVVGQELIGQPISKLREKGVQLPRRYVDDDIVSDVRGVGFIANKTIGSAPFNKPLSVPSIMPDVKVTYSPTSSSTPAASS